MNSHERKPAPSLSDGAAQTSTPPTVIYYHHIATTPRPDHSFFRHASTLDELRREMVYLRQHHTPLSVEEMADRWERGCTFPKRAIVVTFDDGFRSNLEAARLLHDLSIPACFFITARTVDTTFVPSFLRFAHIISTRSVSRVTLDGKTFDLTRPIDRRRWHFRIREQIVGLPSRMREERLDELSQTLASTPVPTDDPDYSFLTSDDLREMRRLQMTVGCHSDTHDYMSRCNDAERHQEMVCSKERLEAYLKEPVEFFAYPDGRWNQESRDLAKQQYRLAFTAPVLAGSIRDRWAYPRRSADGARLAYVMSRRFPWRARLVRLAKRTMGLG